MTTPEVTGPEPVVVVVDDEPQIRRFIRATLTSQRYRVHEASTGAEGLVEAGTRQPDVMIVDLGLPDMDGLTFITRLREWSQVPIIVVSARGQETDKVAALDAGADDYLSKPFGTNELLARIRVALRHAARTANDDATSVFRQDDLEVDLARRRVTVGGKETHLTPIEYRLLTTLVKHAGKVLTRQQLLKEVWGKPYEEQAHYLHVYMGHLRRKIETDPAQPRHLLTEPGVGYRLTAD
jgi:two-component system, OmpR family, KDP operon response regulator KdpE